MRVNWPPLYHTVELSLGKDIGLKLRPLGVYRFPLILILITDRVERHKGQLILTVRLILHLWIHMMGEEALLKVKDGPASLAFRHSLLEVGEGRFTAPTPVKCYFLALSISKLIDDEPPRAFGQIIEHVAAHGGRVDATHLAPLLSDGSL